MWMTVCVCLRRALRLCLLLYSGDSVWNNSRKYTRKHALSRRILINLLLFIYAHSIAFCLNFWHFFHLKWLGLFLLLWCKHFTIFAPLRHLSLYSSGRGKKDGRSSLDSSIAMKLQTDEKLCPKINPREKYISRLDSRVQVQLLYSTTPQSWIALHP